MWLAVIYAPSPSGKKNLLYGLEMASKGASSQLQIDHVGEPVPDHSSPMETNIIPDNNKPGLLWSVLYNGIMKCI